MDRKPKCQRPVVTVDESSDSEMSDDSIGNEDNLESKLNLDDEMSENDAINNNDMSDSCKEDNETSPSKNNDMSDSCEEDNETSSSKNLAWADAMAKVLSTNIKKDTKFILSKAKKDSDVKRKVEELEIVDESGKVIKEDKKLPEEKIKSYSMKRREMLEKQKQKSVWENMCRTKPDITRKERDRELVKIATRGIVQLFNTVEKHQKSVIKSKNGKKDPMMKATKGNFIDVLKGSLKTDVPKEDAIKKKQDETWSILKDDFMMGADIKDWDKDSDDGNK